MDLRNDAKFKSYENKKHNIHIIIKFTYVFVCMSHRSKDQQWARLGRLMSLVGQAWLVVDRSTC